MRPSSPATSSRSGFPELKPAPVGGIEHTQNGTTYGMISHQRDIFGEQVTLIVSVLARTAKEIKILDALLTRILKCIAEVEVSRRYSFKFGQIETRLQIIDAIL